MVHARCGRVCQSMQLAIVVGACAYLLIRCTYAKQTICALIRHRQILDKNRNENGKYCVQVLPQYWQNPQKKKTSDEMKAQKVTTHNYDGCSSRFLKLRSRSENLENTQILLWEIRTRLVCSSLSSFSSHHHCSSTFFGFIASIIIFICNEKTNYQFPIWRRVKNELNFVVRMCACVWFCGLNHTHVHINTTHNDVLSIVQWSANQNNNSNTQVWNNETFNSF